MSADRIDQAWCPECEEFTVLDAGRPCAWCGTMLVKRRGGWKHPNPRHLIPDSELRALHTIHVGAAKASLNKLAGQVWERYGYASRGSCASAISGGWKRLGLKARDRIEVTVAVSTTRGLSPRDHRERSRVRREAGLTYQGMRPRQPLCQGVRQWYPRKGEQCQRPAMFGSAFCVSHDPEREQERVAHLASMRARANDRERPASVAADSPTDLGEAPEIS